MALVLLEQGRQTYECHEFSLRIFINICEEGNWVNGVFLFVHAISGIALGVFVPSVAVISIDDVRACRGNSNTSNPHKKRFPPHLWPSSGEG